MKKMKVKYYGLMHDGELLTCHTHTADDGVEYTLEVMAHSDEIPWFARNKDDAERVASENISWYNTDYETPGNRYAGECKVVELTGEIKNG